MDAIAHKLQAELEECTSNKRYHAAKKIAHELVEIYPDNYRFLYNLGYILQVMGQIKEAEIWFQKSIEINPKCSYAYHSLSLNIDPKNNALLSKKIIELNEDEFNNINDKSLICFAKANIFEKYDDFDSSQKYYILANSYSDRGNTGEINNFKNKGVNELDHFTKTFVSTVNTSKTGNQCIFIVGLPRCGSTLVESILLRNHDSISIGESGLFNNILAKFYSEGTLRAQEKNPGLQYLNTVIQGNTNIYVIDKMLYNYKICGYILRFLPGAKVIHCKRNPFDHILSIFKTNLSHDHPFNTCLIDDITRSLIEHYSIMRTFKEIYKESIYTIDYELLVSEPSTYIRQLVDWLGWAWKKEYLTPEQGERPVDTASVIQVRSPINTKSVYSWMNHIKLLRPAVKQIYKSRLLIKEDFILGKLQTK